MDGLRAVFADKSAGDREEEKAVEGVIKAMLSAGKSEIPILRIRLCHVWMTAITSPWQQIDDSGDILLSLDAPCLAIQAVLV